MKKIIGYLLLALFLFLLLKFVIGVIFSHPKNVSYSKRQITPTPTVNQSENETNGFLATLRVVVFNDKDDNQVRGFGEKGLDWRVEYKVDSQPIKEIRTQSSIKCFPTIFNWLYGGCSSELHFKPGEWVELWPVAKKGWKVTTPRRELELKTGKNLVMFGVRRYRPEEKPEENQTRNYCQEIKLIKRSSLANGKIRVVVKISSSHQEEGIEYRLKVDNQDLGWQKDNLFTIDLTSNRGHIIKGYIKDKNGNVSGGSNSCSKNVGLDMKVQPKTGSDLFWVVISLIIAPLVAIISYRHYKTI